MLDLPDREYQTMPDPMPPPSKSDYPELLRRAADLLRGGWNRDRSGLDRAGVPCGYHSRDAVSFCLMGAIYRVSLDALGGARTVAKTTAFRHTVNQITRHLALALPDVVAPEIARRFEADDPRYGIEFALMTWNETLATQSTAILALEDAADLAEQDAQPVPFSEPVHDTAAYVAWISPKSIQSQRELTNA
jgi:hypothetical protein